MNEFGTILRPSRKTLVLSVLGLAAFLAFEAIMMRRFVRVDTRPPAWDQAVQLEIALDYRQALNAGRWSDFWYLAPKPGMPPFPPAYQLLLRGAYASPDPAHAALWYNWLYLAVLAISLFGISWRFLPDGRALAATLLFCASPGIQDLYTTQLVDLSVIAWTAAAYWALIESQGFSSWVPSLAFGVLYAVGMLHKWSFFSYLIPAYLIAARAVSDRRARPKVLAAAGLSVALFGPWYWSHLALLPSRLVQASSDFAVPFWRGGAWLTYLRDAAGPLGPVLWAMGFIGLIAPQYPRRREYGWILAYWVVTSYVFWTIVPNRQMRFLLPGLAPLGLAFAATWPDSVTWGAVLLQFVFLINFFFGWIPTFNVPLPFAPLPMFVSRPPEAANWHIEDILRRVAAERDPSRPLTNVTLVANDVYFNGPTFHWAQRLLGLPGISMRGVNKRLCELSEFVLLKTGTLGPAGVIGGLPEAADQISQIGGWFQVGYQEIARWPLPDGSSAILYRQRRGRSAPFPGRRIVIDAFASDGASASGLRLDFDGWSPASSSWKSAQLNVARVMVRGLAVDDLSARADNFAFITAPGADARNLSPSDLRIMRLDRLSIQSGRVSAASLQAFANARLHGLVLDRVTLDGTVRAEGRWYGRAVSMEVALELDRATRVLRVRVLSASYMGTPLPVGLFGHIKDLTVSLDPNPETPFAIDLPGLTIKNGLLTIP